ncbi:MAG: PspC domain-containing protein [Crocinitomicaceae bacterium]|nr:PspC domain-containing protein [Crocinitomicaceae bacterium]
MNKTISINIGGIVFNIEENAYLNLYNYLQSIKNNFTEISEQEEIMNDVEARIAEIFQSNLHDTKQVITVKDVDAMIEIMGRPEDYVSDEFKETTGSNSKSESTSSENSTAQKRLFRDTENALLGGVCSGLSHYFNIDVTIIRIIFILLAVLGGSGILIYLVLLFVAPEAVSTSDRMQMKGQHVNLETIKEHFQNLKNEIKEGAKSGKFKKSFKETVDRGVKASSGFAKVFTRLVGIGFIMGGILGLIVLFSVFFGNSGLIPIFGDEHAESLSSLLSILYPGSIQGSLVFISVMIVTLIPVLSIVVSGVKLLFNFRQSFKTIAIFTSILWFCGIALLIVTGINLGMSMRSETSVEMEVEYADTTGVMMIEIMEDDIFSNHIIYDDVWNKTELIRSGDKNIFLGFPELHLTEKKDSGNFEIIVIKKSNGVSTKDAISKAERIEYDLQIQGNKILMSPYFTIPSEDKLRGQQIEVEIAVPFGKKVILGEGVDRIDFDTDTRNRYDENLFSGTTWQNENGRVKCVECKMERRRFR